MSRVFNAGSVARTGAPKPVRQSSTCYNETRRNRGDREDTGPIALDPDHALVVVGLAASLEAGLRQDLRLALSNLSRNGIYVEVVDEAALDGTTAEDVRAMMHAYVTPDGPDVDAALEALMSDARVIIVGARRPVARAHTTFIGLAAVMVMTDRCIACVRAFLQDVAQRPWIRPHQD